MRYVNEESAVAFFVRHDVDGLAQQFGLFLDALRDGSFHLLEHAYFAHLCKSGGENEKCGKHNPYREEKAFERFGKTTQNTKQQTECEYDEKRYIGVGYICG